jgi:quercetin dioxygenase-like cupin family protein
MADAGTPQASCAYLIAVLSNPIADVSVLEHVHFCRRWLPNGKSLKTKVISHRFHLMPVLCLHSGLVCFANAPTACRCPGGLKVRYARCRLFAAFEGGAAMTGITVKAGDGKTLTVLGMPLRFLCDAKDTDGAWSLMEEEIPVGLGPPPHRHDWDEAYYVVEGALDFAIDGTPVRVERGEFAYLPRNTVHAFKGASPSPARVLIFAVPAHSSAFFEDVNREVQAIPEDLAKVPAIGQRHGIEFIPGPKAPG